MVWMDDGNVLDIVAKTSPRKKKKQVLNQSNLTFFCFTCQQASNGFVKGLYEACKHSINTLNHAASIAYPHIINFSHGNIFDTSIMDVMKYWKWLIAWCNSHVYVKLCNFVNTLTFLENYLAEVFKYLSPQKDGH